MSGQLPLIQAGTAQVTTTAASLPDFYCQGVTIQNLTNGNIFLGDSLMQPLLIVPNSIFYIDVTNAKEIWLKTAKGSGTVAIIYKKQRREGGL